MAKASMKEYNVILDGTIIITDDDSMVMGAA